MERDDSKSTAAEFRAWSEVPEINLLYTVIAGLFSNFPLFFFGSSYFFISSRGIQKNPERPLRDYPTFLLLIFTIFDVGFTRLLIGFLSLSAFNLPPFTAFLTQWLTGSTESSFIAS